VRSKQADEDEMISVNEAAKELGLSEKTTRSLIKTGELPAYNLAKRKTMVRRADLRAFRKSRRIAPAKAKEEVRKRAE
jgi:excisionase family DNA binding protein